MADTAPQHKLVYITDSLLEGLANMAPFQQAFPFLRGLNQTPKPHCGSCAGGAASSARQQTYAAAKQALAGMKPENKQKLKAMLNTRQVRVVFRKPAGNVIQLTF